MGGGWIRASLVLYAVLVGATACGGAEGLSGAAPAEDGLPMARPRPALEDAEARAGGKLDIDELRSRADEAMSLIVTRYTVGEIGGEPLLDLVWGDVENYQSGQQLFEADDVVLRFVRRTGQGHDRQFSIVSISASTGQPSSTSSSITSSEQRPDSFTVDLPDTRWAD